MEKQDEISSVHKTKTDALLKEARELDSFLQIELKNLEKNLLTLKQEVINKLADKPAPEKN